MAGFQKHNFSKNSYNLSYFSTKYIHLLALALILGLSACEKNDKVSQNPEPQNPDPVPMNPVANQGFPAKDLIHLSINNDGRFLCLTTKASLTNADNDDFSDVYRYDRVNNQLELISSNLVSNAFSASISADGSRIVYTASQSPDLPDSPSAIYLWDNGQISPLQEGQQNPISPFPMIEPLVSHFNVISPDGRLVAANVDLNHYIFEIATQKSNLVGGGYPTSFSSDGTVHTWLAMDILSPQKQPAVWAMDLKTESNLPITKDTKYSDNPKVSGNGRYVVFASEDGSFTGATDNNGLMDVFLFDRQTPKYTRLTSPNANGESNYPDISDDGQVIVFASTANSLGVKDDNLFYDIYLRINGQLRNLTNAADGHSTYPVLSGDGRYVAFLSESTTFGGGGNGQGANVFIAGPLR